MCGVTGIFATNAERTIIEECAQMCDTLVHRGPDDSGVWADREQGIALGFRRLSIVDLSAEGHQPMHSASGRYVLIFNGEVYNAPELTPELAKTGACFRGHSDTEVILAAFERWGIEAAVQRFVGMFAMAVWDRDFRTLTLVRDRLGIKPLYYYWAPGLLLFGSELKALLAHPRLSPEIDHAALSAYLRYLYVPAPMSILRGVQKLLPGSILQLRDIRTAPPSPVRYWSVSRLATQNSANRKQPAGPELIDELQATLADAVKLRMRADVPVGAFLSGGIDSSLVVALMQGCTPQPVRTYTIGFDAVEWDESEYARQIARHIGTAHTSIGLTGNDALDLVPALPDLFDEPLADPSQIPTYLVSQLARSEVTVALSGDGGDELFAGYHRYADGRDLIGKARRVPRPVRHAVANLLQARSPGSWERTAQQLRRWVPAARVRLAGEKLHKAAALLRCEDEAGMYRSLVSQWQSPEHVLHGAREPDDLIEAVMRASNLDLLDRMMLSDQLGYLPDDLLAKVDRASMAVSLEVRVPLLDHRVVEFSWRVPAHARIRDGETKWLLKQLLERYVPRILFARPKMGFSVPVDRWLRGPLRGWADDLLATDRMSADPVFNGKVLDAAWADVRTGRSRGAMALWSVLMFLAWKERWLPRHSQSAPLAIAGTC